MSGMEKVCAEANMGIVGLGPPEGWLRDGPHAWPTEGYDGHLGGEWSEKDVWQTHYTQDEWVSLCEGMIDRWQKFLTHVIHLSPDHFTPPAGAPKERQ